ncbi:hypothetical protein [Flavobacterium cellulosilyticum]|uniref:Uncharacterized protein n=1 Tax=Flavobacterium cellulosilyticum TaxID=2541731 RepID=A0A4V2YZG2_9FLAO|nr:hypothetical protein [Flavobacterium cellulosilyticum]TDD96927.1 hypothetical protein E0F76_09795 [Flavobacterium cellulosilyticum]
MKQILFLFLIICIAPKSFGQVESNIKFKAIPPLNVIVKPKKELPPPADLPEVEAPKIVTPNILKETNIFNTKPKEDNSFEMGTVKNNFSMIKKNNFEHTIGEVYQSKMTKELSKRLVSEGLKEDDRLLVKIDVNFGEIRTKSKYFVIKYRDFIVVDSDMIKATLNNRQVGGIMELFGDNRQFVINLADGINTFELEAYSKGESGGNTCEFHIFDDQGKEVRSDYWDNWDKGVKGTFVIVKE